MPTKKSALWDELTELGLICKDVTQHWITQEDGLSYDEIRAADMEEELAAQEEVENTEESAEEIGVEAPAKIDSESCDELEETPHPIPGVLSVPFEDYRPLETSVPRMKKKEEVKKIEGTEARWVEEPGGDGKFIARVKEHISDNEKYSNIAILNQKDGHLFINKRKVVRSFVNSQGLASYIDEKGVTWRVTLG